MNRILTVWRPGEAQEFGTMPQKLQHGVADDPLFSEAALERLIDATPRANLHVNTSARDKSDPRKWREGDLGGLRGGEVMEAVAHGNLWVHLQRVHEAFPRYRKLLDTLFADIERNIPGFRTYQRSMSVLISSPNMNVALHADVPGQSLWQVRGTKRVWVYPPRAPYLPQRAIENIVLKRSADTNLPYDAAFEAGATHFDLGPGDWTTWPRNAPHRVRNADCVNVSFAIEYWTDELRAGYAADYANGLLRGALGDRDFSRATNGLAFWGKFALAGAHKAWRRLAEQRMALTIDFKVDAGAAEGFRDVAPYQILK